MTAAQADEPGIIPAQSWPDGWGALQLAPTRPLASRQIVTVRTRDQKDASVELSARDLREIANAFLDRAEVLENAPGRSRRTWRWHVREGEQLLSQSRNAVEPTHLIQRAHAHFAAAAVLRGHTSIQIHQHDES